MTREHKLAIILGFAIVLVVTIVLSDHFSKANTAQLVEGEASMLAPELPLGRDDGVAHEKAPVLVETERGFVPIDELQAVDTFAASDEPAEGPGILASALDAFESTIGDIRTNGEVPAMKLDRSSTITMGEPIDDEPAAKGTPGQPVDPGVRTHVVQEDETLWGIAQRYYADGAMHEQLSMYNRSVVGDRGVLRVGIRLMIPSRQQLLTGRPAQAASHAAPVHEPAAAGGSRTYTVRAGDSLGVIAQEQCGSVRFIDEIMRLNAGTIDDEDSIREGMVLRLPAR